MPGYATRDFPVEIDGHSWTLRALADRQQFADPQGLANAAGISSASWSLFGQVWPVGRLLAERMSQHAVEGKRILEIGCGLALSSLILQRRGADILASDHHPLALSFLRQNAALNGLGEPRYIDLPWASSRPALGRFDLIIGSDVLYERDHVALLASLIKRHATPEAEIVLADPGRGHSAAFLKAMQLQQFRVEERRPSAAGGDAAALRHRLLYCRRDH
jgi:predicted nicotinamide N-methyase